jgi:hypothetical protein
MANQAIIGIFENISDAQKARQALIEASFESSSIEIDNHVDTVDELITDGQMTDTTEKSLSPALSQNTDQEGSILTVQISEPNEVIIVTDIMNDNGAVDVNEFYNPEAAQPQ